MLPALIVPSVRPRALLRGGPLLGFVGVTAQLTLRQYLIAGGFDDSGAGVAWSTSDRTIATVSASGLVTFVGSGVATITATVSGIVVSTVATVALPLSFGLDFAPALRVSDIIAPLVYPSGENPTGTPLGVPIWGATNSFRHAYPVGDGTWGQVIPRFPIFAQPSTGGATNGAIQTSNVSVGPWPASHVDRIQFPAGQTNAKVSLIAGQTLQAGDNQDSSDYKRSYIVSLKANAAGVALRKAHKTLESRTLFTVSENKLITIPADFTAFSDDFASDFERTDSNVFLQSDNDGSNIDLLVAAGWTMPHRTRPRTQELLSPGPWHQTFGMLAENSHTNCWWPSDVPVVTTGTITPSAIPTPDSADYYSAPVYQQIGTVNHATIITAGQYQRCVATVNLIDFAPAYVWCGFKFKPLVANTNIPADGVFTANVIDSTGAGNYGPVGMGADDFCPTPMRDADGGRFYWARVPVNTPHVNIVSATVTGGNLVVVTDNTHLLNVGDPVCLANINGSSGANPNGIFTVSSVQSNTQFTINALAPTGGPFLSGLARHGYTDLKPQIRNEGPDLTFYGTRFAMIAEGNSDDRNTGWHDAWVPRRTVAGPQAADPAWPQILDPSLFMTRTEGWFIIRQMWPFAIGDMLRLGIGKRDFFQGGPAGTGDVFLQGGVLPGLHSPSTINIKFSSAWPDNPALQSWSASCDITAGADRFPRFCPVDIALGWKAVNGITTLQHLGIGMGAGTGITWYQNGDPFFGGTWLIDATAGTAWDYSINADHHLGLMSDLDITGMSGGWLQECGGGGPVPITGSALPADFRNMVAAQIAAKWGARVSYV